MNDNLIYPFLEQYDVFNLYDADSINNLTQHFQNYPNYKWALIHKNNFNIPVLETILKNAISVNTDKIDYWIEKKPGLINSVHSFYGNFISAKNAIKEETDLSLLTLDDSKEKYVDLFIRYFPIILLKLGTLDDNSEETVNELINEMGWEDPNGNKCMPVFLPYDNDTLDLETILEVIDENDNYDEDDGEDEPKTYHPEETQTLLQDGLLTEKVFGVAIDDLKEYIMEKVSYINERLEKVSLEENSEKIVDLKEKIDSLDLEIADLKDEIEEKDSLIENLQKSIVELSEEEDTRTEDTTAHIGALEGEITNLRTELDTRMETESNLRQEIDRLNEQLASNSTNINTEELQKENNELKEVVKKLNFEKNKLSTENTLLKDAVNNRKINNDNFAPPIVEKVNENANNNLAGQVLRANNNTPTIDENIKRLNRFFNKN